MSITMKDLSIISEWATIVASGAGHSQEVVDDIQKRLIDSEIPGGCRWGIEEIKSSYVFSLTLRECLVVTSDDFKDHRIYVNIRDYGAHMDCAWYLTVEPGWLKKYASEKLTGYAEFLSGPKNIFDHQDLRAWVSVVASCIEGAVREFATRTGQDASRIPRGSRGVLEIW